MYSGGIISMATWVVSVYLLGELTENFWMVILAALIASIAPTVVAISNRRKSEEAVEKVKDTTALVEQTEKKIDQLTVNVDGRLTKLLEVATQNAERKGHSEGLAAGKLEAEAEKGRRPARAEPESEGRN